VAKLRDWPKLEEAIQARSRSVDLGRAGATCCRTMAACQGKAPGVTRRGLPHERKYLPNGVAHTQEVLVGSARHCSPCRVSSRAWHLVTLASMMIRRSARTMVSMNLP
jgi:hypothetical protein